MTARRTGKRAANLVTLARDRRHISGKEFLLNAGRVIIMSLAEDVFSFYEDLVPFNCFEDE